jgi:putative oxidoreductase
MKGRRGQSTQHIDLALLILRIVIGVIFIAHGWQKLFIFGLAGAGAGFASMGVPFPNIMGPVVGVVEILGGVALIFGVLTQLASFALACDVAGAIIFFHAKHGFFVPSGIEFVLSLFAAAVALGLAGAGEYSIDAFVARRRADAAVQPTYRSQSR